MEDLWSKSERESGVKFGIQRDSNSKIFQQPKDDALIDCNTEHVTKNLITTVSKKSKSYLEAAKVNLANNNKTFPTGSALYLRFVENEGEPTAESHTAESEVVSTAESPNTFIARPILDQIFAENEGVPTDESPAAKMEGVPTAESPNKRKSCEERAIRRNARNPSGHMANEGDESKFDSL